MQVLDFVFSQIFKAGFCSKKLSLPILLGLSNTLWALKKPRAITTDIIDISMILALMDDNGRMHQNHRPHCKRHHYYLYSHSLMRWAFLQFLQIPFLSWCFSKIRTVLSLGCHDTQYKGIMYCKIYMYLCRILFYPCTYMLCMLYYTDNI